VYKTVFTMSVCWLSYWFTCHIKHERVSVAPELLYTVCAYVF